MRLRQAIKVLCGVDGINRKETKQGRPLWRWSTAIKALKICARVANRHNQNLDDFISKDSPKAFYPGDYYEEEQIA